MVASCEVKGDNFISPGAGTWQTDFADEMPVLVSIYAMEWLSIIAKSYQIAFWMSICGMPCDEIGSEMVCPFSADGEDDDMGYGCAFQRRWDQFASSAYPFFKRR